MAEPQGVLFDRRSALRIGETVRRVENLPRGRRGQLPNGKHQLSRPPILCTIQSDLQAAGSPLTGATYVKGKVLVPDRQFPPEWSANDYTPQQLVESDREEWLVNRSFDADADDGTMAIAQWLNGEWLIIWLDCNPHP